MRKLIVVGATGLVGSQFEHADLALARRRDRWQNSERFIEADVFSEQTPWNDFLGFQDSVLFLSFPTALDEVETYDVGQRKRLLKGFSHFLRSAQEKSARVAFVSSDSVLWGLPPEHRKPGCAPSPINVYGELKASCEELLMHSGLAGSLVVRCTPVGFHRHNLNHGFLGSMLHRARQQKVQGFQDSYITPIHTRQFKKAMLDWHSRFQNEALSGPSIVHFGATASISKFSLLEQVLAQAGLMEQLEPSWLDPKMFVAPRVSDQSFIADADGIFAGVNLNTFLQSVTAIEKEGLA
jgi:dTDP-4-dehydrorhamnose reductase